MISYLTYKWVHLIGVFMVILSLGGVTMRAINGGNRDHSFRRMVGMTHGIGMLLALVGGFGLLARLGVMHGSMPGWAIAKLVIWLFLGAFIAVAQRRLQLAKPLWWTTLLFAAVAAYLALNKPAFAAQATAGYHCEKKVVRQTTVLKDVKTRKGCKKSGGQWTKKPMTSLNAAIETESSTHEQSADSEGSLGKEHKP